MKSFMAKPHEVESGWRLVDAEGKVLGRMASRIAMILQGKHKPTYTPHVLTGDFVVVTNAAKVRITGNKLSRRIVRWHSGYIGGLKEVPLGKYMEKHPDRVVKLAVRRMLPKTKLGRKMLSRLKVYSGPEHPHAAQNPVPLVD